MILLKSFSNRFLQEETFVLVEVCLTMFVCMILLKSFSNRFLQEETFVLVEVCLTMFVCFYLLISLLMRFVRVVCHSCLLVKFAGDVCLGEFARGVCSVGLSQEFAALSFVGHSLPREFARGVCQAVC